MNLDNLFFDTDSYNPFESGFGADDLVPWLKSQEVKFLSTEQANSIAHHNFFDLLLTIGDRVQVDALPKLSNSTRHAFIPYSFEDQDEVSLDGRVLSNVVEDQINCQLRTRKYLFSCDPARLVAVELGTFSYEIVSALAQNGGANTHYVVFDEDKAQWLTLCPEFPFVVASKRVHSIDEDILGRDISDWKSFFERNIGDAAKFCSSDIVKRINSSYVPRVDGFGEVPIPAREE